MLFGILQLILLLFITKSNKYLFLIDLYFYIKRNILIDYCLILANACSISASRAFGFVVGA